MKVTRNSSTHRAHVELQEASAFGCFCYPGWRAGRTPRWTEHLTKDNKRYSAFQVMSPRVTRGPGSLPCRRLRTCLSPPASPSQEPAPADGTSELVLYVKMGLVFRLEIQVGAAVLVKNSSSCVADDGVFGFVHSGEDVIQGLQLLGCEARLGEKSPRNEK